MKKQGGLIWPLISFCPSRFLYGKKVEGVAFVLFGVKIDNDKKSIPDSLRRIEVRLLVFVSVCRTVFHTTHSMLLIVDYLKTGTKFYIFDFNVILHIEADMEQLPNGQCWEAFCCY